MYYTYYFLLCRLPCNSVIVSVECLGKGSYGSVFKATYNDTDVAVKVFNNSTWAELQETKRAKDANEIFKEYQILSTTTHRNIVEVFGFVLHDGYLGMVMEIARCTLKQLIPDPKFRADIGMQYEVLLGIAEGLQYINDVQKIMHRDIKPDNILIFDEKNGSIVPKITDLGAARVSF